MRVLSIDPALRKTGYSVVEKYQSGNGRTEFRALTYGTIVNKRQVSQPGCLCKIREELAKVIQEFRPDECAVEGVIYVQSYKTAITMGAARGAAIIAAAEHGLEVHEYAPRRVKQAVVGKGSADKQQVAFMMRSILKLTETPQSDAADALAIGMTHFYTHDPRKAAVARTGSTAL